jgi:hypothetical protein
LSDEALALRGKFSELISWERAKRREKVLLAALAYAFIVAVAVLPARALFPAAVSPVLPVAAFVLFTAAGLWLRPWKEKDSLGAVLALDRALGLQARAVTAAEIVRRDEVSVAERYVLHQADEKLQSADVRALFKREWPWQALAAPALVALWLALVWLGVGADWGGAAKPRTLAEKLKEYSRELEQKAEAEKLAESLKVARALKSAAEERITGKSGDEKLRENLAAIQKGLDRLAPAGADDFDLGGYTREEVAALKAELEAARGRARPGAGEKELLDRLESMPRADEAMKRAGGAMENMSPGELKQLIDKLQQEAAAEMERRSLADVQQYLSLLLNDGRSGDASSEAEIAGRGAQQRSADKEKRGGKGELPGDEPGVKGGRGRPPQPSSGAAARVTGVPAEGASSGVTWRAEAKAGESRIPESDAPASYRRQVEEDLASEKIPPALKETVKKYFLSLDDEKNRR